MHVRIFEKGASDHGGLHDFNTEVVPQVGDVISLEGGGHPSNWYKVVSRMVRVDTTVDSEEAVFYVGLEVAELDSSTTLTRLFR